MLLGRAGALLGLTILQAGCANLDGLTSGADAEPGQESGPQDASVADATVHPEGGDAGDGGGDSSVVAVTDASTFVDGPCGVTAYPVMVAVPIGDAATAFCIDSTEVTTAEYAIFLRSAVADASVTPRVATELNQRVPGTCMIIGPYDLVPTQWGDASTPYPVQHAGWCQAFAYCLWAGKTLCGGIDGGTIIDNGSAFDASVDEWYAACSAGGVRPHPYGINPAPFCDVVGGAEGGADGSVPVASDPDCQGGYAGIYDLEGNVREWENGIVSNSSVQYFRVRGTAWTDLASDGTCLVNFGIDQGNAMNGREDTGFRCCKTPP